MKILYQEISKETNQVLYEAEHFGTVESIDDWLKTEISKEEPKRFKFFEMPDNTERIITTKIKDLYATKYTFYGPDSKGLARYARLLLQNHQGETK